MFRQPCAFTGRVALVGPTASGKTAVGVALAARRDLEIVSADSMQVYRRMDVGTAKPTPAERARAVFHAIDVVEPDQPWTLADYQRLAEDACAGIAARGRMGLIVGGTGLYVRALTTRLDIPSVPPDSAFRAHWQDLAAAYGSAFVQQALARVDPVSAARIHVNDLRRLIRALEVYEAAGIPLSDLHARNQMLPDGDDTLLFGLHFADREALYARIEARVDRMLADGLVEEVRSLWDQGYGRGLMPMQGLGYRHIGAFLTGDTNQATAVAEMKRDTRRFARRQLIWFRGDPRVRWIAADGKTADQLAAEINLLLQTGVTGKKGTLHPDEQTAA